MEICCKHPNSEKDYAHPGLLWCNECDALFFDEDRTNWKQPWHLPKNMWKDTLKCMLIITGTIVAAFIVKEAILNL